MPDVPIGDLGAGPVCPIPIAEYPHVTMAHGGGGKLSQHLIERMFLSQFTSEALRPLHDGAHLGPHLVRDDIGQASLA